MCFDDFVVNYNRIYVLRLLTDDVGVVWDKHTFKGEWKGPTSGGCSNYGTWVKNPQFGVKVKERDTKVFFSLMQPDQRYASKSSEGIYSVAIGAYVLQASDIHFKKSSISNRDIVSETVFLRGREFSMEFLAQPDKGAYVIMPAQFVPGNDSSFYISVFTSKPGAEILAITDEVTSTTSSGAWMKGTSAGGCTNHPTWTTNPQFVFTFSESSEEVEFFLEPNKNPPIATGLYLFKADSKPEGKLSTLNGLVKNSEFINLPTVSLTAPVQKGTFYVVMPTTFEANQDATFKVGARSIKNPSVKIEIKPMWK